MPNDAHATNGVIADPDAPDAKGAVVSPKSRRVTRRKYIAVGGAVLAAGVGTYYGLRRHVKVGIIGVGLRGEYHAWLLKWLSYGVTPYGQVRAICDVDIERANSVRDAHWPSAKVYQDYRQLLKSDEIEAVYVATHDSWHAEIAIDAMRAGKAVYLEKPISLTVEEGFRLRDVANETKAIVQVGTQQRSNAPFHTAWELVNNGRVGELKRIVVSLEKASLPSDLSTAISAPPRSLDWNMWLGPTADVPYCEFRQKGWHHIAEYAGGELTNWGSHHLDIALWASGNHNNYPLAVDGRGTALELPIGQGVPGEFSVSLEYAKGPVIELRTSPSYFGILFEGNRGKIFVNRSGVSGKPAEELATNPLPPDAVRIDCRRSPMSKQKLAETQHYRDFFDCIQLNQTPISDIQSSVCVHTALHLGINSIALGRPIEFDPETMSIKNDAEATALMSRARRPEFPI